MQKHYFCHKLNEGMSKGEGVACLTVLSFIASFVAYVVAIGVGWGLDQNIYSDSLIRTGIIIASVPVFSVIFFCCTWVYCGSENGALFAAGVLARVCIVLAGVLEIIGGIILIVGAVKAKKENSKAFSYGITAGIFCIFASIGCFLSMMGCAVGENEEAKNRQTLEEYE